MSQLFFSRYDSLNRLPLGFILAKKATKVLVSVMKLEIFNRFRAIWPKGYQRRSLGKSHLGS